MCKPAESSHHKKTNPRGETTRPRYTGRRSPTTTPVSTPPSRFSDERQPQNTFEKGSGRFASIQREGRGSGRNSPSGRGGVVSSGPLKRGNKNQHAKRRRNNHHNHHHGRPTSPPPPRGATMRGPNQSLATPHSPPTHDAPMTKRDIYFALDCEMVGVGPGGYRSALARVSIVNWANEIVLDRFVRVNEPVTDYRTFVSGVTARDLNSRSAIALEECRYLVESILRGKILIGHDLRNDLEALGIIHPWTDLRDTAAYGPYQKEKKLQDNTSVLVPRRLRDLASEVLGRKIQQEGKPHSPLEDAVAALDLYKAARKEWEQLMSKRVMEHSAMEDALRDEQLKMRVPLSPPTPTSPQYVSREMPYTNQQRRGIISTFPPPGYKATVSSTRHFSHNRNKVISTKLPSPPLLTNAQEKCKPSRKRDHTFNGVRQLPKIQQV